MRPDPAVATVARGSTSDGERRVLDAMDALLAEGTSYTALDIGRITERGGIARTSFYNTFPDKLTVLLTVLRPVVDQLFGVVDRWAGDPAADAAGLRRTTLDVVAVYRDHAHLLGALAEAATYEPRAAAFWQAHMEGVVGTFRRRIEEARRPQSGVDSTDSQAAAMWLAWGTERAIAHHVAAGGDLPDERFADAIADNVWATMTGHRR
ncbi:hypothetical protein DSM112329_04578 [Paraconexibacter sp. AEG42_29]|uniref:HTH tetR-type domain-containing protein n=1 Tax=Paraconexibacter sp. AEG42_29 TaxID=2997339 RepID=A0AAU7B126_9ACTN